jgi:O-antigen/teichoic acid export membrane protein
MKAVQEGIKGVPVRMAASAVATVVRSVLSVSAGILIARGLGAEDYGNLSFLLASCLAIVQLTDMGTSTAFYTFLSQRPRGRSFMALYLGWLVAQFIVTLVIVGLVLPESLIASVWVGEGRGIVLVAFIANFFMARAWGTVTQLGEAARQTVLVQFAGVVPVAIHVLIVGGMVLWSHLTVSFVLLLLIVEYALAVLIIGPMLLRDSVANAPKEEHWRSTVADVFRYCRPLVIYTVVAGVYNFADRWLLQLFGGATQQGYFAIGQQFATISLLATTAVLRVFWKEIAEARELNDESRAKILFDLFIHRLLFLSGWLSFFLIPFSREVLIWTVGPAYASAWPVLACLLLYPICQTLNQIQGTFFFATNETEGYARVGINMMLVSLPLAYFMLAPRDYMVQGLQLGALGIAIKMVAVGILTFIVQSRVIAKKNGWLGDWTATHRRQVAILSTLCLLGLLSKWSATILTEWINYSSSVLVLVCSAVIYALLSVVLIRIVPSAAGLKHGEVMAWITKGMRWKGL